MTMTLAIGTLPPVGEVPPRMLAQTLRSDRLGDPRTAFRMEEIDTPRPKRGEVLVGVMAAGVNFNNVWAARGVPIDVIAVRQKAGEPYDFHVGGSDASGIVYAVGEGVTSVAVGDAVSTHHGWWDPDDPWVRAGKDPMLAPSARIWGSETNFGGFGQFALVKAHQALPKPAHLTWEEAAASTLVGSTAYRMLFGWSGNVVRHGDVVLVWGGAGGLGGQAIQLAAWAGAKPIAVVSSAEKAEYCRRLGAVGTIDRTEYQHWGVPPHWDDADGQKGWMAEARRFGKAIWDAVGERHSPDVVFEHPGEDTVPTSMFVCADGGMVVICAGTTGYSAMVDVRYLWVKQKRFQGSHGTNQEQAVAYNRLVREKRIDPCLARTVPFDELGQVHWEMGEGTAPMGNTAVLVGAPRAGLGRTG